jgi:hypothetical protein
VKNVVIAPFSVISKLISKVGLKETIFCCLIPERFEKKKFLNIFQTVDQIHFKYSKCL